MSAVSSVATMGASAAGLGTAEALHQKNFVGSGPNGANAHHEVGPRIIEDGDMVVPDFGGHGRVSRPGCPHIPAGGGPTAREPEPATHITS